MGVYWGYFHPPTYRITIPDIRSGTISAAAVSGVSGKFSKRLSPSNVSVRLDHPTDAGSPMPPMPVGKNSWVILGENWTKNGYSFTYHPKAGFMIQGLDLKHGPYGPQNAHILKSPVSETIQYYSGSRIFKQDQLQRSAFHLKAKA